MIEDRETPRMHKYGESKTTGIIMVTILLRDFRFGTF
jgi:hypothetical protein